MHLAFQPTCTIRYVVGGSKKWASYVKISLLTKAHVRLHFITANWCNNSSDSFSFPVAIHIK